MLGIISTTATVVDKGIVLVSEAEGHSEVTTEPKHI